jgi:hypothetical protein
MFNDLYDALSFAWSWSWPRANGEVTAIDIERGRDSGRETLRLGVAYKFCVGEDGPYTGESFWAPNYFVKKRVIAARRKLRVGEIVSVRYRADNPSINKVDRRVWQEL